MDSTEHSLTPIRTGTGSNNNTRDLRTSSMTHLTMGRPSRPGGASRSKSKVVEVTDPVVMMGTGEAEVVVE
jgi:hypothetical protein